MTSMFQRKKTIGFNNFHVMSFWNFIGTGKMQQKEQFVRLFPLQPENHATHLVAGPDHLITTTIDETF